MKNEYLTWKTAPEVLTVSQAAILTGSHINSVRTWIHNGDLKATQTPGGHWRIHRPELARFIDKKNNNTRAQGYEIEARFQRELILQAAAYVLAECNPVDLDFFNKAVTQAIDISERLTPAHTITVEGLDMEHLNMRASDKDPATIRAAICEAVNR